MSAGAVQAWMPVLAGLVGVIVTVLGILGYKTRRARLAVVGASFKETVDALSADNEVKRMAAAVLLRRYFDRTSEQGVGRRAPYRKEAIEVIAGMLRQEQPVRVQKVLADGLRYAVDLTHTDLQRCDLSDSYIGQKVGDPMSADLTEADLFGAICLGTSFRNVTAVRTVFYGANLRKAVFEGANCQGANFRDANCQGAKFGGADLANADFTGAKIGGARFRTKPESNGGKIVSAKNIPTQVASHLDAEGIAAPNSVVSAASDGP